MDNSSSTAVKRNLLVALGVIGAASAVISLIWLFVQITHLKNREPLEIPPEDQITKMTASVNDLTKEMAISPVPEFTVPRSAIPTLLAAIKPVKPLDAKQLRGWDDEKGYPKLAVVNIHTKSGPKITIVFYDIGKGPVGFTVNGVSCLRGGPHKPVLIAEDHQDFEDESVLMTMIIREIYKEQQTDEKSENLPQLLDALKRSRGEKPPERKENRKNSEKKEQ